MPLREGIGAGRAGAVCVVIGHLGSQQETTSAARTVSVAGGRGDSPNAVRSGRTDQHARTPTVNTVVRVSALILMSLFCNLRAQAQRSQPWREFFAGRRRPPR